MYLNFMKREIINSISSESTFYHSVVNTVCSAYFSFSVIFNNVLFCSSILFFEFSYCYMFNLVRQENVVTNAFYSSAFLIYLCNRCYSLSYCQFLKTLEDRGLKSYGLIQQFIEIEVYCLNGLFLIIMCSLNGLENIHIEDTVARDSVACQSLRKSFHFHLFTSLLLSARLSKMDRL